MRHVVIIRKFRQNYSLAFKDFLLVSSVFIMYVARQLTRSCSAIFEHLFSYVLLNTLNASVALI